MKIDLPNLFFSKNHVHIGQPEAVKDNPEYLRDLSKARSHLANDRFGLAYECYSRLLNSGYPLPYHHFRFFTEAQAVLALEAEEANRLIPAISQHRGMILRLETFKLGLVRVAKEFPDVSEDLSIALNETYERLALSYLHLSRLYFRSDELGFKGLDLKERYDEGVEYLDSAAIYVDQDITSPSLLERAVTTSIFAGDQLKTTHIGGRDLELRAKVYAFGLVPLRLLSTVANDEPQNILLAQQEERIKRNYNLIMARLGLTYKDADLIKLDKTPN